MSTTKTSCPNCSKAFDVPTEYLGKRATCASCKNKFVVAAVEPIAPVDGYARQAEPAFPDPAEPPYKPTQSPPPTPSQAKPVPVMAPAKRFVEPKTWVPVLVGVCSLVVGFFAGREQMKYQIRSTMQQAFQSAFPGLAPKPAANANVTKAPAPVELPPLAIGQRFEKPGFALALTKASIGKAKLKAVIGKTTFESDDDYLIMSFMFSNTEDRKQRAFHDSGSKFSGSQFQLKDDVGNVIRGVDFGYSSKLIGALVDYHDIAPSESVEHTKVFSLPLPKTKHVVLTINLECLGGDGEMSYIIPMESIARKNQ